MANKRTDQLTAASSVSDTDNIIVSQGTGAGQTKKALLSVLKTWILTFVTKGDPGTNGTNGSNGTNGTNGTNGQGVPVGGTSAQVLAKIDATDYHTHWVDQSGGIAPLPFPTITGLVHDFDFTDLTSQSISGGLIAQITDKIGSVVSVQATGSHQPMSMPNAGPNNLPFALFDGNRYLAGVLLSFTTTGTIIMIRKQGGVTDEGETGIGIPIFYYTQGLFQNGNDGSDGYGFATFLGALQLGYKQMGGYASGHSQLASDVVAFLTPRWETIVLTADSGGSPNYQFFDGLGSYHAVSGAGMNTPTTKHNIGTGFGQQNFIGGIARILCHNRVLTQTEIKQYTDWALDHYKLEKPNHIVVIGDSITADDYAPTTGNYGEMVYYNLMPEIYLTYSNKALSGETADGILARLTTDVLNQYNPDVTNVFVMMIGHNGGTYPAIKDKITSICQQCQATGYKVIIETLLYSTAAADSAYDTVNNWIRFNWPLFADALCDSNAITNLLDPTNATYYRDGVHLTDAGSHEIANVLEPIIKSFL